MAKNIDDEKKPGVEGQEGVVERAAETPEQRAARLEQEAADAEATQAAQEALEEEADERFKAEEPLREAAHDEAEAEAEAITVIADAIGDRNAREGIEEPADESVPVEDEGIEAPAEEKKTVVIGDKEVEYGQTDVQTIFDQLGFERDGISREAVSAKEEDMVAHPENYGFASGQEQVIRDWFTEARAILEAEGLIEASGAEGVEELVDEPVEEPAESIEAPVEDEGSVSIEDDEDEIKDPDDEDDLDAGDRAPDLPKPTKDDAMDQVLIRDLQPELDKKRREALKIKNALYKAVGIDQKKSIQEQLSRVEAERAQIKADMQELKSGRNAEWYKGQMEALRTLLLEQGEDGPERQKILDKIQAFAQEMGEAGLTSGVSGEYSKRLQALGEQMNAAQIPEEKAEILKQIQKVQAEMAELGVAGAMATERKARYEAEDAKRAESQKVEQVPNTSMEEPLLSDLQKQLDRKIHQAEALRQKLSEAGDESQKEHIQMQLQRVEAEKAQLERRMKEIKERRNEQWYKDQILALAERFYTESSEGNAREAIGKRLQETAAEMKTAGFSPEVLKGTFEQTCKDIIEGWRLEKNPAEKAKRKARLDEVASVMERIGLSLIIVEAMYKQQLQELNEQLDAAKSDVERSEIQERIKGVQSEMTELGIAAAILLEQEKQREKEEAARAEEEADEAAKDNNKEDDLDKAVKEEGLLKDVEKFVKKNPKKVLAATLVGAGLIKGVSFAAKKSWQAASWTGRASWFAARFLKNEVMAFGRKLIGLDEEEFGETPKANKELIRDYKEANEERKKTAEQKKKDKEKADQEHRKNVEAINKRVNPEKQSMTNKEMTKAQKISWELFGLERGVAKQGEVDAKYKELMREADRGDNPRQRARIIEAYKLINESFE